MISKGMKTKGTGMSSETANLLSFWGNWILLAALVVGAMATGTVVIAGIVKDRAFEEYKLASGAATAQAVADAENAREGAAKANAIAPEANERAAILEAKNLELEANLAPRRIKTYPLIVPALLAPFAKSVVRVTSFSGDPESAVLAGQILHFLSLMKFKVQDFRLTQGTLGSISFGILVNGPNKRLVSALISSFRHIDLVAEPGEVPMTAGIKLNDSSAAPPDATIFVALKPLT